MGWLTRFFNSQSEIARLSSEVEFWKVRAEEYRSLFEGEREDRRKAEDSFRVNVHQAKPVYEPESKIEEVNPSDPDHERLRAEAEDVDRHAWAAATNEDMWAVAQDMARQDVRWVPVLRRAAEIRSQMQAMTVPEDEETVQ